MEKEVHLMRSYSDIEQLQAEALAQGWDFWAYVARVYNWLFKLEPGKYFLLSDVKMDEAERPRFTLIISLFISEGNSHYRFSNDFKKIHNDGKT